MYRHGADAGGGLDEIINGDCGMRLPVDRALEVASDVASGLHFVHSQGVVHRDLKPANIWLTEDGRAKVGDFGIALWLDRTRLTMDGGAMLRGTVSYMPPEQVLGTEVTQSSDLYALGALRYEMICGQPPFTGDNPWTIAGQQLQGEASAPSELVAECPPGLDALILDLRPRRRKTGPATRPRCAGAHPVDRARARRVTPSRGRSGASWSVEASPRPASWPRSRSHGASRCTAGSGGRATLGMAAGVIAPSGPTREPRAREKDSRPREGPAE